MIFKIIESLGWLIAIITLVIVYFKVTKTLNQTQEIAEIEEQRQDKWREEMKDIQRDIATSLTIISNRLTYNANNGEN